MIAENLSSEEEKGLQQMFNNIDTDGSGTITLEELRDGLARLGSKLTEPEIKQLMDAVRVSFSFLLVYIMKQSLRCKQLPTSECLNLITRLMLTRVEPSITLNLSQLQCIDIGSRGKRTYARLSTSSTRIATS